MGKWRIAYREIGYDNRWVRCIMQDDIIVAEADNFSDLFLNNIVHFQNESVSKAYKDGLYEGVAITREVYNE